MSTYHSLPELDSSMPDNDVGKMVAAIILASIVIGLSMLWLS